MSDKGKKTEHVIANDSATVSHLQRALGSERIFTRQMTTAHLNVALGAEKPQSQTAPVEKPVANNSGGTDKK